MVEMLELIKMNEQQYKEFIEYTLSEYAAERIKSADWLPEYAERKAREDLRRILPEGFLTPDAYFYILAESNGQDARDIGCIWFNVQQRGGAKEAFLYDIFIREADQGKGYGTQAMLLLEQEARELRVSRIGLHVFGHNVRATRLYYKMGYEAKSITMYKEL